MSISATKTLASKELRHLLPLIIAMLALEFLGLFEWFVSQSPDTISWANVSVLLDPELAEYAGPVYLIVGIVTAYMLFPHENDQNTLQFLWSLPIARWQIYLVKILTAFLTLIGLLVIGHLLLYWINTFGVNSISNTQFTWQLWWFELAALFGITAISLGYGALVAHFRIVGVLGFIVFWTGTVVVGYRYPSMSFLDPSALMVAEYRGTEILLPAKGWATHAALSFICLVLAGILWTRDGQRSAERKRSSRIGTRIVYGIFGLLAFLYIIGDATVQLSPRLVESGLTEQNSGYDIETIQTQYYEISHYATDRGLAQIIQKDADLYAEQIQQLLGIETSEITLADLTDDSEDHLGIAGWKKMRIGREALHDSAQRDHVFVHESTHVLAAATSNRRLQDHNNYTIFFNEGLAEWVSYEILELTSQQQALKLLSALAWKRHNLRFEDFLYASSFRSHFDENLIYALGVSWVSTLANVCGTSAPGEALRSMARDDAPQQLRGSEFWQDTLQAIGCNLSAVNARFELEMRDLEPQVTDVPVLDGALIAQEEKLSFTLTLTGTPSDREYNVFVKVRDAANVSPAATSTRSGKLKIGETLTLAQPRTMIGGKRFQYQIGFNFIPGERPFFGRWIDEG